MLPLVDKVREPVRYLLLTHMSLAVLAGFGVDHLTIQMETPDFEDEAFHFCVAGTACFRSERE